MIGCLRRNPQAIYWLLGCYFLAHTITRCAVSTSLSFDEAEQAFLSQWVRLGYNSQPPLYTWIQASLFKAFGRSVFAIAVFKNAILLSTYLCVYAVVNRITRQRLIALVASLGMFTIPQVAWESHRDLSHTVLVTLATGLLLYVVVRMEDARTLRWYLLLGFVCALGVLAKYNFAITILATFVSGLTIRRYRQCVLDRRMVLSVVIALFVIAPHAHWIIQNLGLATGKTVGQLRPDLDASWLVRVETGGLDLVGSTIACCCLTLFVFVACGGVVGARRCSVGSAAMYANHDHRVDDFTTLVERFFIVVAFVLVSLVMSGNAVTIKNHWLHPYVFLLPTYVALKTRFVFVRQDGRAANRVIAVAYAFMAAVLIASVAKPVVAGWTGKYSWLNKPYRELAQDVHVKQDGDRPHGLVMVTADMRTAGNLVVQFSHAMVLSCDHPQLQFRLERQSDVVAIVDRDADWMKTAVAERIHELTALDVGPISRWEELHYPYYYAQNGDAFAFHVALPLIPRLAENSRYGDYQAIIRSDFH